MRPIILLNLVAYLLGCAEGTEPSFRRESVVRESSDEPSAANRNDPPIEEAIELTLAPLHLTTSFVGQPEVVVAGHDVDDVQSDLIARAISLSRWPEAEPIPVEVTHVPPDVYATYPEHRFVVRPTSTLEPGWYELGVLPPPGFALFSGAMRHDNLGTVRFHVGSLPLVRHVSFSPGDREVGVFLELSERVRDSRPMGEVIRVSVDGARPRCVAHGVEASRDDGTNTIGLVCDWFDVTHDVTIELPGDIHALEGLRLTTGLADPTRLTINPTTGGLIVDEEFIASRSEEVRRRAR